MNRGWNVCLYACIVAFTAVAPGAAAESQHRSEDSLRWHISYRKAAELAEQQRKLLLIYFYDARDANLQRQLVFEHQVLANPDIRRLLSPFVLLLQPTDAVIYSAGERIELLKDESFYHMYGSAGVAIIDLAHRDEPYFRHVVSAFPFDDDHFYGISKLKTILTLPPGSLTQRTLTYAVRMHPERPSSADGRGDTSLISYAENHSQLMASIQVQGHHNWEQRFHELASRIPGNLEPTEVAAESWPGQSLVDAAVECVHSWRQSDGHWESVRGRHPIFGFDMKRGRNGIWYATGIFGRRR